MKKSLLGTFKNSFTDKIALMLSTRVLFKVANITNIHHFSRLRLLEPFDLVFRKPIFRGVLVLLISVLLSVGWAEVPFPVIESGKVHLTEKNSPYLLETSVVFSREDTLIIDPGVQVLMMPYAKILLRGAVSILGTEQKPVVFKSLDSTKSWSGVHFVSNTTPFLVQHLIVENAFRNSVTQSGGIFESVSFIDNYYGLWVNSSNQVYLRKCSFSRNRFALSVGAGSIRSETTEIFGNVFGLYLEKGGEYLGNKQLIKDNLEADVRKESDELAGKGKRVSRSVWHRIESSF